MESGQHTRPFHIRHNLLKAAKAAGYLLHCYGARDGRRRCRRWHEAPQPARSRGMHGPMGIPGTSALDATVATLRQLRSRHFRRLRRAGWRRPVARTCSGTWRRNTRSSRRHHSCAPVPACEPPGRNRATPCAAAAIAAAGAGSAGAVIEIAYGLYPPPMATAASYMVIATSVVAASGRQAAMFSGGDAYERFMGRWSRELAPLLVKFAGVRDGNAVLDVGSGTGALTAAVAAVAPSSRIIGVDPAASYVAFARRRQPEGRVRFEVGQCTAAQVFRWKLRPYALAAGPQLHPRSVEGDGRDDSCDAPRRHSRERRLGLRAGDGDVAGILGRGGRARSCRGRAR